MRRSTSTVRRACAVGTTVALIGLTTGLGVMSATAASAATDPAVSQQTGSSQGAAGTDGQTSDPNAGTGNGTAADTGTTDTGSGTGTAGSDAGSTGTPADTDTTAPGTGTGTGSEGTTGSNGDATNAGTTGAANNPETTNSGAGNQGTLAAPAAATTVQITGTARVGSLLQAKTTGYAGPHTYAWTRDGDDTVLSTDDSYTLTTADIDHVITLTVTDTATEVATSAKTDKVSEDVRFADSETNTDEAPFAITADAGVAYSHSFAVVAGSGTVSYSVGYTYPEDADPEDGGTPSDYLPDGVTLNAKTGLLSGTSTTSGSYDFTIVASNGTSTATEYVEVTVNPDVAVGVLAFAADATTDDVLNETKASNAWIIAPDGSITTIHRPADLEAEPTFEEGGQPTVKQGQSLWVQGYAVDQYGNTTQDYDEETGDLPRPVVTSDVASDQIAWDEDEYATKITFPHASTHTITVAQDDVSVSFPVTVVPTASTVAVVKPLATGRQLAYTGTDATGALPWALGFVLAGAGLIGARTLRRRRTQD
ncbi:putative Ig domain-containing protein [Curtobacterium sp. SP.BCo]|uniref:putative Ig domain-containing protein n=1 Tax=Curtobacterium sp. SP.BCo TaxID=3435229 RepID=UPI003F732AAF